MSDTVQTERPQGLYAILARACAQISKVPKAGINTFHGYHYVTEADVVHLIRTALLENGLCFWSSVVDQQRDGDFAMVCVEFIITDVDTGESLSSTYWGSAMDKGDKALFKAYAGATKYWALKCFLIPTLGDDPEADHHVDEQTATAPPPPPKSPKSAKAAQAACVACGTVLPPAVRTFSERRFGKPLCIGCQKGATA